MRRSGGKGVGVRNPETHEIAGVGYFSRSRREYMPEKCGRNDLELAEQRGFLANCKKASLRMLKWVWSPVHVCSHVSGDGAR